MGSSVKLPLLRREREMNKFLKLSLALLLGSNITFGAQNQINTEFQIHIPKFLSIKPITSPVLYANITNRTGNLYSPLSATFRVVTNTQELETLYLSGKVDTLSGKEDGFFEMEETNTKYPSLNNVELGIIFEVVNGINEELPEGYEVIFVIDHECRIRLILAKPKTNEK